MTEPTSPDNRTEPLPRTFVSISKLPVPDELVQKQPAHIKQKLIDAIGEERLVLQLFSCQPRTWIDWNAGPKQLWDLWRRELGATVAPPPRPNATNYEEASDAIDLFHRTVETLPSDDTPAAEVGNPEKKQEAVSEVSLDGRALGVFIENPDLTKKNIAKKLGCHEKSLAPKRCPKLDAAIRAYTAKIEPDLTVRGSTDDDGNIEAWEEDKRIRR